MDLEGKVIILTGARRIGQTVAEELAKKGADLAVIYRGSKEESEAICETCTKIGIQAFPFQADLSKEPEIKKLISAVKSKFDRIDALVHMAAPYPKTLLESVSLDEFTTIQQAIGGSALILAKHVVPVMLENKEDLKGKIIFFSDWSVLEKPYHEFHAYNMAKAGINSLTFSLANELAPEITVNAIAPGPILKPPDLTDKENKEALAGTPLKRWGGAEEIAKAVIYLLEADFVTGVVLPVDGGRTIG